MKCCLQEIKIFGKTKTNSNISYKNINTKIFTRDRSRIVQNRDHTTIIHSVKTIEKLKENDKEMAENIDKLKKQILYNNKENENLV